MKELLLSDYEAHNLIKIVKNIIENHTNIITSNTNTTGKIDLKTPNGYKFILNYKYSETSKVFQFRETKYNYTLIRININNNFHKNSNGEKIYGNRINIFSEQEYINKNDGRTHCICYSLPFEQIRNTNDFFLILEDLLKYINVKNQRKNIDIKIIQTIV